MLQVNKVITSFVKYLTDQDPFTNVYGLARSILAFGTLLTFISNDVNILFRPALGIDQFPICQGLAGKISLFCIMNGNLTLAKWIAVIILITVITGWRPRFTGVLQWWICFSFMNSSILVDGGDQVTEVLSLLLIPITLLDDRRWHWSDHTLRNNEVLSDNIMYARIIGNSSWKIIRIQVAIIYLHAAFAKCNVPEWQEGTALYYWFTDPMFGLSGFRKLIFAPIISNAWSVTLLTWSIILLEYFLFAGLIAKPKYRSALLVFGIAFHIGIAVIHGLISFFIAMVAALILYLRPANKIFRIKYSRFKFRQIDLLAR